MTKNVYYLIEKKSWINLKSEALLELTEKVQELKSPCNKSVTWGHLGHFSSHECEDKVKLWCDKIERPSKLQYMHIYGKLHKKSYLM